MLLLKSPLIIKKSINMMSFSKLGCLSYHICPLTGQHTSIQGCWAGWDCIFICITSLISRLFSHLTAASLSTARWCSPPTNRLILHSSTMGLTVCIAAPQPRCEDWTYPYSCIVPATLDVPISSLLKRSPGTASQVANR